MVGILYMFHQIQKIQQNKGVNNILICLRLLKIKKCNESQKNIKIYFKKIFLMYNKWKLNCYIVIFKGEIIRNENISITYNNGTILLSEDIDAIEIYSINGTLVMQQEGHINSVAINLNKGIYIIRAINNGEITTCKIAIK